MTNDDVNAGLTGAAVAAMAAYSRYDNDTQDRIRQNRNDTRTVADQLAIHKSQGENLRSRLPVVQDAQVGLSIATAQSTSPAVVPSQPSQVRPDLTANADASAEVSSWPPRTGTYDSDGLVSSASGEMTSAFLALTYQEVRAFISGLAQSTAPAGPGKVQIRRVAHALVSTVASLSLSVDDYKAAWARLFSGSSGQHDSPATPPVVSAIDPGITSIKANGLPDLALGYEHQNSDCASKWRIQIGAGNIGAGVSVFAVTFGSPYTKRGKQFVPVVTINDPRFLVTSVSPTGFFVINQQALVANTTYEIGITVSVGC